MIRELSCNVLLYLAPLAIAQTPPSAKPAEPVKPEDKCKLSGQVLNASTGEGVRKANLSLQGPAGSTALTAITDAEGKFEFTEVLSGRYLLSAEKNGFMKQTYGARSGGIGATTIALTNKQELKGISFKLMPQGIIAGRVLDDEGEPMGATMVMAMHYAYDQGKRQLVPAYAANSNPLTNDQGEFRIANLPPGKYYVMATRMKIPTGGSAPAPAAGKIEEGYVTTYFPNVPDANSASAIDVAPGAEVRGMDIRMRKARTVRVRGKILDTSGQPAGAGTVLSMARRDSEMGIPFTGSMAMVTDGKFELTEVAPGPYYAMVIQTGGGGGPMISRYPVDVGDKDLEGVVISLSAGFTVAASLKMESGSKPPSAGLRSIHATLMPNEGMPLMPGMGLWKEDGSIQFKNVAPDRYRLELSAVPDGIWVKAIHYGNQDVTDGVIDLTAGAQGNLDIVLASGGGSIGGTVRNAKGQPAPGALVTLAPKNPPAVRRDLFRTGFTDQNGNFQIHGIVPGEYRLMAWEEVEEGAAQDPEFRRPFERLAIDAKFDAGSSLTQSLEMVSKDALEAERAKGK